jgi:hypothetical protein
MVEASEVSDVALSAARDLVGKITSSSSQVFSMVVSSFAKMR